MSGSSESVQDKAIHDYLESLLMEVSDDVEESKINPQPQVKIVTHNQDTVSNKEPEEKPAVIGLEKLVAEIPEVLPLVETVTAAEIEVEQIVSTTTQVAVETEKKAPPIYTETGVPVWAEERFQCLLFKVSGLSLAVPLVKLNSVISWDEDALTETPNKTRWYLGLIKHLQKQVKVIDTALLVMPENRRDTIDMTSLNRLGNILLVDDYRWGLACDSIGDVIWLTKNDVKWRKNKQTKAWLAGTSLEHLCAVMDTEVFAQMLTEKS